MNWPLAIMGNILMLGGLPGVFSNAAPIFVPSAIVVALGFVLAFAALPRRRR